MAIHIPASVQLDEELLRATMELAPHLSSEQTTEFNSLLATYDKTAASQDGRLPKAFEKIRDAYKKQVVDLRRMALIRTIAARKAVATDQSSSRP